MWVSRHNYLPQKRLLEWHWPARSEVSDHGEKGVSAWDFLQLLRRRPELGRVWRKVERRQRTQRQVLSRWLDRLHAGKWSKTQLRMNKGNVTLACLSRKVMTMYELLSSFNFQVILKCFKNSDRKNYFTDTISQSCLYLLHFFNCNVFPFSAYHESKVALGN